MDEQIMLSANRKVRDRKESGSQYSKFGNACPKRHYDATRSTLDIHRSCPTCGTTPGPLLSIPEQRDRGGFEKMYNISRTCDFAFFAWAAPEQERAPHSPRLRKLNEMKGVCFSASRTCPHQVQQKLMRSVPHDSRHYLRAVLLSYII